MQKNQLLDALNMIQDENTVIRGTFEFDREFSAAYECRITGVTITYSKELEAVIHFQEVKQKTAKEEASVDNTKVGNVMTKGKLQTALTLISNDEANLYADFVFDDPWGNQSYKSCIYGVELQFSPDGIEVVVCTRETKEEDSEVAA